MHRTPLFIFVFVFVASNALAQQLEVKKIAEGVYVHISSKVLESGKFPSNGLLIETPGSVILVDTPWDVPQTDQLLTWIGENVKKPVSHCIVTHSHDDRVSGINLLKAKHQTKIYSGRRTARKIKDEYASPEVIVPDDSLMIIDGVKIQTYFPGEGHSSDNIVVWLPELKILFGGCFVKSVESAGLGNIADANLKEWPLSVSRVQQKFRKPKLIIPGHQSWESGKSLEHTLTLLKKNAK
jgi:metallo-beta-lactamase class B